MSFQEYKEWFKNVFGSEATNIILNEDNESLNQDGKFLDDWFNLYRRYMLISGENKVYKIKGCLECINDEKYKIAVRKQDCPGFLGQLSENDYIVIGLESNAPQEIHIAYDHYPNGPREQSILFNRIGKLITGFRNHAYVTDIAKCRSTNLHLSRQKCLRRHFITEIDILLRINNKFKVIFQGTGTASYFKNYFIDEEETKEKDIKSKKNNKLLFGYRQLHICNRKVDAIILPHASIQNSYLWKEIESNEYLLREIKKRLREIGFY